MRKLDMRVLGTLSLLKSPVGFPRPQFSKVLAGRRTLSTQEYAALRNEQSVLDHCFNMSDAFKAQASTKSYNVDDFLIYPNFVTKDEHDQIASICEKKLKRSLGQKVEYHPGHFDQVIHQYRECSASQWGKQDEFMKNFIKTRIYSMFPDHWTWLDPHILGKYNHDEKLVKSELLANFFFPLLIDLNSTGEIKAHVDNVEYSGSVVAGLCLLSPAIMKLRHKDDPNNQMDVLLNPGTFYIQRDSVRYAFTHEITLDNSVWNNEQIDRERRISLLFRDKKV